MPKPKRYARIAITLPKEDLHAADRLAAKKDRSRSWIVAEAIRRYTASADAGDSVTPRVRPGLGASRLQQLKRDLALTPEQRVREAEETALLTQPRESARVHQLMAFDRYEDFLQWQRLRDLLP